MAERQTHPAQTRRPRGVQVQVLPRAPTESPPDESTRAFNPTVKGSIPLAGANTRNNDAHRQLNPHADRRSLSMSRNFNDMEREMNVYLKIKIKSLAAEAAIIRAEERKWPGPSAERFGLHEHRVQDVRRESRAAGLAYGFLRGRRYRALEAKSYEEPNWKRVQQIAEKFGRGDARDIRQRLEEWKSEAPASALA